MKKGETIDIAIRFWEKVSLPFGVTDEDCWEWIGNKVDGRGRIYLNGILVTAPRVAFLIRNGRLPDGMALHKCDNPGCVNPSHIYEGTGVDNMKDRIDRGRNPAVNQTHCKRGHPFSKNNTGHYSKDVRNRRHCKACAALRTKKWRDKNKNGETQNEKTIYTVSH